MALLNIPTKGGTAAPNINFRVTLDGSEYQLRLRYNDRDETWSLSLFDSAGVAIRQGIRCVVNFPLTRQIADARVMPGVLYWYDSRGDFTAPPTLDELGAEGTAVLVYSEDA